MPDEPERVAAPAHEMTRPAAELLSAASASGDRLSESQLQEQLGVGHDDLMGILDQLREHGKAVQVAPGEWSGPEAEPDVAASREAEDGRVRVSVPDNPDPEDELPMPAADALAGYFEPTLKLNRTAVEAMSAQSLGEVIKATIDAQGNGEEFWLQVTQ